MDFVSHGDGTTDITNLTETEYDIILAALKTAKQIVEPHTEAIFKSLDTELLMLIDDMENYKR